MKKHDSLTVEIARLALAKLAGGFTQDDKWITVHPNGPDHKGSPILLDDQGVVKGGAGGKFTGKKISEIGKKGGGAGGVMAKPTPPDFLKNHDGHMGWNGTVYGDEKRGHRIYVGGKEYKVSKSEVEEFKKYKSEYKEYGKQKFMREKEGATYLNVPYAEKDKAKAAGAQWDPERGQWFVQRGEVPEKLQEYAPSGAASPKAGGSGGGASSQKAQGGGKLTEGERKDLLRKEKEYDRIYNEGGEGYNPYRDKRKAAESQELADWGKTREGRKDALSRKLDRLESTKENEGKIQKINKELAKIKAEEKAEFKAAWPADLTQKRRKEWNARIRSGEFNDPKNKGKISASKLYRAQVEQGWFFEDLKEAVKINKL